MDEVAFVVSGVKGKKRLSVEVWRGCPVFGVRALLRYGYGSIRVIRLPRAQLLRITRAATRSLEAWQRYHGEQDALAELFVSK